MLNCRLAVDVGSDFDSLNFAPSRLPYLSHQKTVEVKWFGISLVFT